MEAKDCSFTTTQFKFVENNISFLLGVATNSQNVKVASVLLTPVDDSGNIVSNFKDSGSFGIVVNSTIKSAYFESDLSTEITKSNNTVFHGAPLDKRKAWFSINELNTSQTATIKIRHLYDGATTVTSIDFSLNVECLEPTSPPNLEFSNLSTTRIDTSSTQDLISISSTVINSGGTNSTSSDIKWYRSTDSNITSSDAFVSASQLGPIIAGETGQSNPDVSVNLSDYSNTSYYLGGCIDAVTNESDTTDNCSNGIFFEVTNDSPITAALTVESVNGVITSTGINCPSDCIEEIEINSNVTLTAIANTNYEFSSWNLVGSCGNSTTQDATPHIIDFEFSGDCTATAVYVQKVAIDGVCGSSSRNYLDSETSWGTEDFCSIGISSPTFPIFPSSGGITEWSCMGSNGGIDKPCSASLVLDISPSISSTEPIISKDKLTSTVTISDDSNITRTSFSIFIKDDANSMSTSGIGSSNIEPVSTYNSSANSWGFVPRSNSQNVNWVIDISSLSAGDYEIEFYVADGVNASEGSGKFDFTKVDDSLSSLTVSTQGQGSISSIPIGIACGSDCSYNFTTGQKINLYAVADSGWVFDSWTGVDCIEANCEIALNDALEISAIFIESTEVSTATRVISFSPDKIEKGEDTYITINGENLPSTMVVNIEGTNGYCVDDGTLNTSTVIQYLCNAQTFGSKRLYVKDMVRGNTISGSEHWYIDVAKPANTAPSVWVDSLPFQAYVGERLAITAKSWDHEGNLRDVQVDWEANGELGSKKTVTDGFGSDVQFAYYPQTSGILKIQFIAEDDLGSKTASDIYSVNILPAKQIVEEVTGTPGKELASQNESACSGASVGNPVNPANGAKLESASLLSVNGIVPIEFTISYNSLIREQSSLGIGWDFSNSHAAQITEDHNGNVIVSWSKNQVHTFTKNTDDSYSPQSFGCRLDVLTKLDDGRFQILRRDRTAYIFNEFNFLSRIENIKGQGIDLEYNSNGQLSRSIEPVSQTFIQFSYDQNNYLIQANTSAGRYVYFEYTNGRLTKITHADGVLEEYEYSDLDQIITKKLDGITVTTSKYDERGRVIEQDDAKSDNQLLELSYDESDIQIITTITDKNGYSTVKTFDKNYQLLKEVNALGHTLNYEYNEDAKPIRVTDANGNSTNIDYNNYGDILQITTPDNGVIFNEYDANRNKIKITDQNNGVENFIFDDENNLTTAIDKLGNETSFTYDNFNRLETTTTPESRTTTLSYLNGFLYSLQNPEGYTKYLTHDADGRLTAETDFKGNTTSYTHDGAGRVATKTDPLTNTEEWTYTTRGNVATYKDKKDRISSFEYNLQGENTKITKTVNGEILDWVKKYDGESRLIEEIDPNGNSIKYIRDAIGRTTSVNTTINGQTITTQIEYDNNNNVTASIDAMGNKTNSEFDNMNRIISVTDPLKNSLKYAYDLLGRTTSITDPMFQVTRQEYDANSSLLSVTHPGNLSAAQKFDNDSNLINVIDPAQKVRSLILNNNAEVTNENAFDSISLGYSHDENGRLSTSTNGRGQTAIFSYDQLSRKSQYRDNVGTITYSYDEVDNVEEVTQGSITIQRIFDDLDRVIQYKEDKSKPESIGYQYDKVSNLTKLTYPNRQGLAEGHDINYSYDSLNRVTSITGFDPNLTLASFTYDANSRVETISRANGSTLTLTYDASGRLTLSTDLDINDNIILKQAYHYDDKDRLVMEESLPVYSVQQNMPSVETMSYGNGNQLLEKDGISFGKDGDGNILEAEGQALEFNARNQLIKAGDYRYSYNAEGHRISHTLSNGNNAPTFTSSFVISPHNTNLTQTLRKSTSDEKIFDFIYGPQGLLAQYNANEDTYYFFHYDYRGSVVAITDSQGEVVARFGYQPFGQQYTIEGIFQTPFGYNGRDGVISDPNNLIYMRTRYYSPSQKRFISKDPLRGDVSDLGSLNRYAYVGGDPVNFIDPSGKTPLLIPLCVLGLTVISTSGDVYTPLPIVNGVRVFVKGVEQAGGAYKKVSGLIKGNEAHKPISKKLLSHLNINYKDAPSLSISKVTHKQTSNYGNSSKSNTRYQLDALIINVEKKLPDGLKVVYEINKRNIKAITDSHNHAVKQMDKYFDEWIKGF